MPDDLAELRAAQPVSEAHGDDEQRVDEDHRLVQAGERGLLVGGVGVWFEHLGRLISWTVETGRPGLIGRMGLVERKMDPGLSRVPQRSVLRPLAR